MKTYFAVVGKEHDSAYGLWFLMLKDASLQPNVKKTS